MVNSDLLSASFATTWTSQDNAAFYPISLFLPSFLHSAGYYGLQFWLLSHFHWVYHLQMGWEDGSVQVTWMSFALTFLFCVKHQKLRSCEVWVWTLVQSISYRPQPELWSGGHWALAQVNHGTRGGDGASLSSAHWVSGHGCPALLLTLLLAEEGWVQNGLGKRQPGQHKFIHPCSSPLFLVLA